MLKGYERVTPHSGLRCVAPIVIVTPFAAFPRLGAPHSARGIGTTSPRIATALLAFAVALVADLGTKQLILSVVMAPPRVIEVAPFLNLTLGFNTGVSFGLLNGAFADRPMLLAGITGLIAAGLLVWAMRSKRLLETFGLGLIAGGAAVRVAASVGQAIARLQMRFRLEP